MKNMKSITKSSSNLLARTLAVLVMLTASTMMLFAVPAKPGLTRLLTLADGTTVNATLVGDEHGHFWKGADGKSYQLVPGTGNYQEVNSQDIVRKAQQRRTQANQRRTKRMAPQKIGEVGSISGQKKGLIILVNFSDVTFKNANNNALYQRIANEQNFTYTVNSSYSFKGSMYDYFKAQSEGLFELTFDVVGPVTVSKTQAYYGANDSSGNDEHPAEMVIEAIKLADSQVNYADYDWDGNGTVEQVYVVYAGKGEADGGDANTIWPHEYDLNSAKSYGDGAGRQKLDGVWINTYACGGELNGSGVIAGIGTMCHEFSHCLGYPDFYDTDYSGGQGMGYWDLMCSGSYNDNGYQPAGYTSYERWVAGWKTPIELVNTQSVSKMAALQTTGSNSYVIYNKGNKNEYYLLENRQKTGWDASLPGAGLLILHVDYNSTAWTNNTPNDDPSHQRMTWIAADNNYQYTMSNGTKYYSFRGMKNDPFPYGSVNAFGKNTTPAATLYNNNSDGTKYLDSSIEHITQNGDGTISFDFNGESNEIPADPAIVADESLTFSTAAGSSQTKQLEVMSEGLTEDITLTLTDANGVFSLGGTSISKSLEEATVDVTFSPTAAGSYTGTITLASAGAETVTVQLSGTATEPSTSDPNTTTFKLVTSTDNLQSGMRYIIACGSKKKAAGAIGSGTFLSDVEITLSDEVITINDNVAVFVLEQTNDGWTFKNESTNQYLQSTTNKNVSYSSTASSWTLSNGTAGVIMTAGSAGTMLYNVSSPRFTTYTSNPSTSMIQANLYMEYSDGGSEDPGDDPDPEVAYYQNADGKKGAALKTAMCGIIYNRTEKSYDYLWTAYKTTDVRSDGKIWDMYSNITNYTPVTSGSSYSKEGDTYNREHSWPQSWFGSNAPMYTDLHHIYPTDGFVNGKRANYPFGETNSPTYTSANDFSKLGPCSYSGYTGTVFEPADEYKGDFARTYFYMVTCYEEKLHDWYTNYSSTDVVHVIDGSTYPGLQTWQLNMLMEWAKNDPVSEKETARNNAVYAIQNNRNPFIDYPGLEEYIWGTMTTTAFSYDNYVQPAYKQDVQLSFSPATAAATVGESFTEPTLSTTPANLTVTYSSSTPSVATVDASTGEVTLVAAGTTTITATFAGNDTYNSGSASYTLTVSAASTPEPAGDSDIFELVTDASTLAAGDKILIAYVNGATAKAMSATQSNNNRPAVDVTQNTDGTLTPGSDAQVITLEKDGSNYLFNVGDQYLYAASSSSNWLRTEDTADANAKATVSISDGNATITFQGTNTRNTMRYNPNGSNPIFSCYVSTTSTGSAPQIYRMIPAITLADATDNASTISGYNGKKVNATLADRTLYKDGAWNTLCLPFDVTIADSPLAGATVKKLTASTSNLTDGKLTLNFETEETTMSAGTPYIIKWENTSGTIDNPIFNGVTINSSAATEVGFTGGKFVGSYGPVAFTANDKTKLFLGAVDTLYWPDADMTVNAFRAYFDLGTNNAREYVLNFGEGLTTGILNDQWTMGNGQPEPWFTIDGRKLSKKPATKGLYIYRGKKMVIK